MKLHLPLSLRSSLLSALCLCAAGIAEGAPAASAATMEADWQNTAYIGDSITHGYSNTRSYRWHLFKILVDNSITQNEVGLQTGYNKGNSNNSASSQYGGVTFENHHASQSGIWAAQVAGERQADNYFGKTGIQQWLGLDNTYTGSYVISDIVATDASGNPVMQAATPDTAFVMLGTNDILHNTYAANHGMTAGDTELNVESNVNELISDAKRYLDTVVDSLRKANGNINIIVTTLPAWSDDLPYRTSNSASNNYVAKNDEPELLAQYNAALAEWAEEKEVTLVDVNKGMIDVAKLNDKGETSGYALDCMYGTGDGVHPSNQGDLIIAGNIAQQLGYAGRTAGQLREAADTFAHQAAGIFADSAHQNANQDGERLALEAGATLTYTWEEAEDLSSGFTVDFRFANGLGNGATDGWSMGNFSLTVGDSTHTGTLNINEAYIKWGDTILYSMDVSQLTDALRVAYIYGDSSAEQGLSDGFYIWLGDMLIGEAQRGTGGTNGLSFTNGTGTSLTLEHLSLTAGAFAPTNTGLSYGNPTIEPATQGSSTQVELTGKQFWQGPDANILTTSTKQSGMSSGNVDITVSGQNSLGNVWLIANNGGDVTYSGDVNVTLTGKMTHHNNGNRFNAAHYLGTLDGSISLTVAKDFTETNGKIWGGFVGAVADAANAPATVKGNVSMTFSSDKLTVTPNAVAWVGCAIAGVGRYANVEGAINITVNQGTFNGDVYGGVYTAGGSIGSGTHVTLNGGTVAGNVYGGGKVGTITGGTNVTVTGGATVTGSLISAGGNGDSISGGTLLTIKDVNEDSAFTSSFKGTLSGGNKGTDGKDRILILDGVKTTLQATLENFDSVSVTGESHATLSSLGGATSLNVDANNRLVLAGGNNDATVSGSGTIELQQGASLRLNETGADANTSVSYELRGGSLTVGNHSNLSSGFLISSGTFTKENAATSLNVDIVAEGAVTLGNIAASDISHLETVNADALVSGLSGTLELKEVMVAMGINSVGTNGAALLFSEGGLSVGTLTLNLDAELSAALAALADGGAVGYTATGSMPGLVVNSGSLSADRIIINLAEDYGDYVATADSISQQDGYSYVNYSVSKAIPEPATATLSLLALAALAARRRKRG